VTFTQAVKIGVIGCGGWGANYVRLLASTSSLAFVYDVDPNAAYGVLSALGLPDAYLITSWRSVLAAGEADGLVIVTPAEVHAALAADALGAGFHVLVEKPLALRYSDARLLAEMSRASNRVLAVGHLLRQHPATKRLGELMASGAIGAPQFMDFRRVGPARLRSESLLFSLAVHDVDIALLLADDEPARVMTLSNAPQSADFIVLAIDFVRGWRAVLTTSWLAPVQSREITIVGSRMIARWDQAANNGHGVLTTHAYSRDRQGRLTDALDSHVAYDGVDILSLQLLEFANAIAGSPPARLRIAQGLDHAVIGIGILAAGLTSMANCGAPVGWPPPG